MIEVLSSTESVLIKIKNKYLVSIDRNYAVKGDKHFIIMLYNSNLSYKEIKGELKEKIVAWYLNDCAQTPRKYIKEFRKQ